MKRTGSQDELERSLAVRAGVPAERNKQRKNGARRGGGARCAGGSLSPRSLVASPRLSRSEGPCGPSAATTPRHSGPREQIRDPRMTPLVPLLEKRGLQLVAIDVGNFLVAAFSNLSSRTRAGAGPNAIGNNNAIQLPRPSPWPLHSRCDDENHEIVNLLLHLTRPLASLLLRPDNDTTAENLTTAPIQTTTAARHFFRATSPHPDPIVTASPFGLRTRDPAGRYFAHTHPPTAATRRKPSTRARGNSATKCDASPAQLPNCLRGQFGNFYDQRKIGNGWKTLRNVGVAG